jgi:hypothetical protein
MVWYGSVPPLLVLNWRTISCPPALEMVSGALCALYEMSRPVPPHATSVANDSLSGEMLLTRCVPSIHAFAACRVSRGVPSLAYLIGGASFGQLAPHPATISCTQQRAASAPNRHDISLPVPQLCEKHLLSDRQQRSNSFFRIPNGTCCLLILTPLDVVPSPRLHTRRALVPGSIVPHPPTRALHSGLLHLLGCTALHSNTALHGCPLDVRRGPTLTAC